MGLGGVAAVSAQASVESITLFVALLSVCIVIGHLLKENRWFNESINALFIGLATGIVLLLTSKGVNSRVMEFNEELFFIYLLPPIIFNAGFQVKKKRFFKNFATISMFGAVGTVISFCIISFGVKVVFEALDMGYFELQDYLAIGAIFSATDSVCTLQVLDQEETPLLYSIVFGEGVVNDATSVVLFNAIQKFDLSNLNMEVAMKFLGSFFSLFITSTLLGVMIGLLCAYIVKELYNQRHSTDQEVALMILMAYLSYMIAQLCNLSGILTVFFCGIVMSHYTLYNMTASAKVTTKHVFATMSFIAETFIFLYVGMDALDIEKWAFASESPGKSIAASAALLGLVAVGRAAFVIPLSLLSNLTKMSKLDEIDYRQQLTIWWAGLIRGAVSMALAYNQFAKSGHTKTPGNAIMITSTITVVLFSTVVFGFLTKHLINTLLPEDVSGCSSQSMATLPLLTSSLESEAEHGNGRGEVPRRLSLQMLLTTPTHVIHQYWRRFDNSVMRPIFGGRGFVVEFVGRSMHERG
ncbi:sodium/hydrogen exchanger 1-like [Andrographis paniculata]|uniref:sodium/hydrogen exchanger 1-like n=1 Tax=Andrographis paniculata TaxID=175694 RepID=UPI0021E7B1CD|nr:sodium/hydrogen exchanger 1-like [Andrographis paniculata]